jgi:subtilase family serine protease
VTCVGDMEGGASDVFTVHVYKTADETIHSTATIDPANTVVETNEDNNSDQGTG